MQRQLEASSLLLPKMLNDQLSVGASSFSLNPGKSPAEVTGNCPSFVTCHSNLGFVFVSQRGATLKSQTETPTVRLRSLVLKFRFSGLKNPRVLGGKIGHDSNVWGGTLEALREYKSKH